MSLVFEWDPKKAAANLAKHGVAFEEALTVFVDPFARIFDDEDLLVVCFVAGGASIRIFSARQATKKERRDYEENVS